MLCWTQQWIHYYTSKYLSTISRSTDCCHWSGMQDNFWKETNNWTSRGCCICSACHCIGWLPYYLPECCYQVDWKVRRSEKRQCFLKNISKLFIFQDATADVMKLEINQLLWDQETIQRKGENLVYSFPRLLQWQKGSNKFHLQYLFKLIITLT